MLSYGRPLTSKLTMQFTAGGESSTLKQTGANAVTRTFLRPKGSLSLAWAARAGLDVSLRLARRVGQLNFADFLASVNLGDDNQNAGNEELVPQQSWEAQGPGCQKGLARLISRNSWGSGGHRYIGLCNCERGSRAFQRS